MTTRISLARHVSGWGALALALGAAAVTPAQAAKAWPPAMGPAAAVYVCLPGHSNRVEDALTVWSDERQELMALAPAKDGQPWPDFAHLLMVGGAPDQELLVQRARPGYHVFAATAEHVLPIEPMLTLRCLPNSDDA